MPQAVLTISQARRIALHAALLDGRTRLPKGAAGVLRAIEHLGYVQLDTIAVVERAHNHTLWARVPDFAPAQLDALLGARRIFEYWGHAASFLPMADYRYYLPLMRRHREQPQPWVREQRAKVEQLMPQVLERIRDEGPRKAADFEHRREERGAWWDWKPAKSALELLFWEGELMITARQGFQRVYDLTARVLPPGLDTREPDAAELGRFAVRRALTAMGVARERDIAGHLRLGEPVIAAALRELCAAGEVEQLSVAGKRHAYYAQAGELERLLALRRTKPRLHILSPFDNFAIHRDRMLQLFDFDYTIECYTPAHKRKYGYFNLPLLWGETIVGRLDAKAERKAKVLSVRGLWLEDGFSVSGEFTAALAAKLREFAQFNGCEQVRVEQAPAAIGGALQRALASG